jgi:hypothetical protein
MAELPKDETLVSSVVCFKQPVTRASDKDPEEVVRGRKIPSEYISGKVIEEMEATMEESARLRYLKIATVLIGAFCVVGVYPLTIYWPSGWTWHTDGPSLYLQMILGIYATLGVFLTLGAAQK